MQCEYCNQEIEASDSCDKNLFYYNGTPEDRLKHLLNEPCDDCGVKTNGYHHVGCHEERCPMCTRYVMECYCDINFKIQ
jgi:hypothetical protein